MRSIFARRSATISSGVIVRAAAGRRRLVGGRRRGGASSSTSGGLGRVVHRPRAGEQAVALELRDFRGDLVERRLHGLDAGRGEVRQIGLGGGARRRRAAPPRRGRPRASGAPRGCAPSCSSKPARSACDVLVGDADAARAGRRTCAAPRRACASEATIARAAPRAAPAVRVQIVLRARRHALSSSRAASSSRWTSIGERARALDERGVRRLRLRGAPRLRLHRLARLEQPPLRGVQLLVGGALLDLDPRDRLARLVLPRFLRAQLLFGRSALGRDLILLAGDPVGGVAAQSRPAGRSRRSPSPGGAARACSDRIADSSDAIVTSSAAIVLAQPIDARRARRRRARAVP